MKTIASLPVGQANELVERLNELAIPHVTRVILYPSGADLGEIMVEESYFDRTCEAASAWNAEQLSKLAADKKSSSTPTATAKSKWPLLWAFFSGLFFVIAVDALHDNNTSWAVIRLILSAFCMLKAVQVQNGGRFRIELPGEPETRSGKIAFGVIQTLSGAALVAYQLFLWREIGGMSFLLLAGLGIAWVFDGIKTIYKLQHAA